MGGLFGVLAMGFSAWMGTGSFRVQRFADTLKVLFKLFLSRFDLGSFSAFQGFFQLLDLFLDVGCNIGRDLVFVFSKLFFRVEHKAVSLVSRFDFFLALLILFLMRFRVADGLLDVIFV